MFGRLNPSNKIPASNWGKIVPLGLSFRVALEMGTLTIFLVFLPIAASFVD